MTWAVWAPLLLPWITVPAARRLAALLPPRPAALLLAGCAALAGVPAAAATALLAAAALLHLPAVAALGHLSPALLPDGPAALALGTAAVPGCLAIGWAALRTLHRHRLRHLHTEIRRTAVSRAGDVVVLADDGADAYALPGRPGRRGRPGRSGLVVVTTGMLRALDDDERAVLLAHERAHLAGHHHLLAVTADLAACLHPALRGLRRPLAYQAERWADEVAARTVGDRRLVARAVGRAALAAGAAPAARRPAGAFAATAGPVPRRMAALLAPVAPARPVAGRATAVLLLCLLGSAAATVEATGDLHENIETAQCAVGRPAP
ncbi:M48 family metalloprotease [Kitasatospora sp. NPDC094015]|uniref:M48 family metalloprotease n=1 Tax=Kitasatospora sp. NPDC094015 TaxID=3155205 RepID=UPI00332834A1